MAELTLQSTATLIRQSNLIEGITDLAEIPQSMRAWKYLQEWSALSHAVICCTQDLITQNHLLVPQRGFYRSVSQINVRVGNHTPPAWHLVDALMDNWLLDYESLEPFEAHRRFEHIHPFVDGNGRTGRMLLWWQEIRNGQEPTLIEAKDRFAYYARLDGTAS